MDTISSFLSQNWDLIRTWTGGTLCILGAFIAIVGAIGVLRFPDFYSRNHAASMTDTLAAGLLLLGMMLLATGWIVVFKLALIGLFLLVTVPTGAHAIVHAANVAGQHPLTGRYRSGEARKSEEEE